MQLEAVELQEPVEEWMDWKSESPQQVRDIPAPPWTGWENSPLAPRHCKWLVRLGRGPCMQVGKTPGFATLPIGYGERNTSPNRLAWRYRSERRSCDGRL